MTKRFKNENDNGNDREIFLQNKGRKLNDELRLKE